MRRPRSWIAITLTLCATTLAPSAARSGETITLDQAIGRALEVAPTLANAAANSDLSRARVDEAQHRQAGRRRGTGRSSAGGSRYPRGRRCFWSTPRSRSRWRAAAAACSMAGRPVPPGSRPRGEARGATECDRTSALRRFFCFRRCFALFQDAKNINLHETTDCARHRKLANTGRIPAGVRFAVLF